LFVGPYVGLTDSCFWRNGKGTPDPVTLFHKNFDSGSGSGSEKKRRIRPESTPLIRPRCQAKFLTSAKFLTCYYFSVILLLRIKKLSLELVFRCVLC